MKRPLVSAFLLLIAVSVSRAQVAAQNARLDVDNVPPDFSAASAAKVTLPSLLATTDPFSQPGSAATDSFAGRALSAATAGESGTANLPAPSPPPRFIYGGREDYRWQLGLSFVWFRFQSSVFNANAFGEKTTVTYFLNEWLGVEGTVTGAFGPDIYRQNGRAKFALYGAGPKIGWRQKRWEPWIHGIFGGVHESPQTAAGSRNSYLIMAGGGEDYRWNPHISFRLEGDYVLTGLFHTTQNCFLLAPGVVFHF